MALHEQSTSRRAFVKVLGALTSFVVFVKCKTVGAAAAAGGSDLLAEAVSAEAADFFEVSKALTGFSTLDGTLTNQYYLDMKAQFGDETVQKLTDAYKAIAAAGGDVESEITAKITTDAELGKASGAAIMLWYWGTFGKLQPEQPVAVRAYQKGLVWQTFKGKPMGVPDEAEGVWGVEPTQ